MAVNAERYVCQRCSEQRENHSRDSGYTGRCLQCGLILPRGFSAFHLPVATEVVRARRPVGVALWSFCFFLAGSSKGDRCRRECVSAVAGVGKRDCIGSTCKQRLARRNEG